MAIKRATDTREETHPISSFLEELIDLEFEASVPAKGTWTSRPTRCGRPRPASPEAWPRSSSRTSERTGSR